MKTNRITKTLLLISCLLAMSSLFEAGAQTRRSRPTDRVQSRFTSGSSALGIPLENDNNILFLRVSVNGSRPLRFIFDTGASVSVINSKLVNELGLKVRGQASGTATGGNITVGLIKGVSLSVPGAEVTNQMIASFGLDDLACVQFDGVIGYDFINQFIVEIDYQKSVINLYDPRTYTYSGNGDVIPLQFPGRTPLAVVNITIDGHKPIASTLEVDTGGDGTVVIYKRFVKRNRLLQLLSSGLQNTGVGAGGEQKRIMRRIAAVQLGRFVSEKPVANFSLDEAGSPNDGYDGIIGGEILRRFKVIFDYSRKRMMLEQNSSFTEPYEVGMSGIGFESDKENCTVHKIESIEPNSPASEAGLQPGDILTAVDAKRLEDIPSNEFEQLFKQNGKELILTIKRGQELMEKRIRLRRSI